MYGLPQPYLLAQRSVELLTVLPAFPSRLHQALDLKAEQELGAEHSRERGRVQAKRCCRLHQ